MYQIPVPVFVRLPGNHAVVPKKGEAHAQGKKMDPAVLIGAAKGGAARLAGAEQNFAELCTRIDKTVAHLKIFESGRIDGAEECSIEIKVGGNPLPRLLA